MAIKVIGAGLAGCEAAWQAANAGAEVILCEMKPIKRSAAHKSDNFAELVCRGKRVYRTGLRTGVCAQNSKAV